MSFPGEEGRDAAGAFNKATSSKRQSAARRCGGRVNASYGVGSAQSVHSRGMLRVPRSSLAENERVDASYTPFLENFKSPATQRLEGMRYFRPSQRLLGHKCSLL